MSRRMSNFMFKGMSFLFSIRDFFHPPKEKVAQLELQAGFKVLDYGCGPGSYTIAAAELIGESGKVYALDIHPLAIKSVQKRASKKNLTNIETKTTDCATGLADKSIDCVLMFDVFHGLPNPEPILKELHRVLKPNGILAFDDHHLSEQTILSKVTANDLFQLLKKQKTIYLFEKKRAMEP